MLAQQCRAWQAHAGAQAQVGRLRGQDCPLWLATVAPKSLATPTLARLQVSAELPLMTHPHYKNVTFASGLDLARVPALAPKDMGGAGSGGGDGSIADVNSGGDGAAAAEGGGDEGSGTTTSSSSSSSGGGGGGGGESDGGAASSGGAAAKEAPVVLLSYGSGDACGRVLVLTLREVERLFLLGPRAPRPRSSLAAASKAPRV
jgi:hypothetical protein